MLNVSVHIANIVFVLEQWRIFQLNCNFNIFFIESEYLKTYLDNFYVLSAEKKPLKTKCCLTFRRLIVIRVLYSEVVNWKSFHCSGIKSFIMSVQFKKYRLEKSENFDEFLQQLGEHVRFKVCES